MDYKSEVIKVHQSANAFPSIFTKYTWIVIPVKLFGFKVPSWIFDKPISCGTSVEGAWQAAYENITNQSKTTHNGH